MAETVDTPESEYNRGIEDYRKEQIEQRTNKPLGGSKLKMLTNRSQSRSPKRERNRSRSPIRRKSRSRSPRRDDRRSKIKGTKGKEYRVYVSNMNYSVKWMNLKDVMKKAGPVDHVEVFTDGDGKSKGCGVVEFSNKEDAEQAIKEYDGYELMGRPIRCREDQMDDLTYYDQLKTQKEKTKTLKDQQQMPDYSSSLLAGGGGLGGLGGIGNTGLAGTGWGAGLRGLGNVGGLGAIGLLGNQVSSLITFLNSKGGDPINSSVFISNLDYNVTWQTLKDMLRKAGNCRICNVAVDEETKKSKGYGSAQFDTPMEALTAIALYNGKEMGTTHRPVIIRLDRQAQLNQILVQNGITEVTQQTLVQLQSLALLSSVGLNNLGGLGALGGLNSAAASTLGAYQGQSNLGGGAAALGGLSNLSGLSSLGGLGNLLGSNANALGGSNSASNIGARSNIPASFGVGGSFSGTGTNYTAGQQLSNYSITGVKSSGYSTSDSRGRSSESSGTTAKTRVFVRNLPFSIKWQDLKDKFRDAGRIVRADVKTDDQNRSKGCGTVTFETNAEALRAVDTFNGIKLEGRTIEVRMDRAVGDR